MEPQGIFISYRREQTAAHAGRIYDRLSDVFGEQAVFMDIDSIGLGLDFTRVLNEAVSSCSVMLVLIGPGWAEIADQRGRRLDDPTDYVRQELEAGLRREIRVVPVLVRGAALPQPEALPEGLRPLVRRQAFPMPDETFRAQAQVLVERLRPLMAPAAAGMSREPESSWTVELIGKSAVQRVFQVRLTNAQHLVTYNVTRWAGILQVDDVIVARRVLPTKGWMTGGPTVEIPFQLSDGDAARQCTFSAYYGTPTITRAVLTVNGRLLYDEGPQASVT